MTHYADEDLTNLVIAAANRPDRVLSKDITAEQSTVLLREGYVSGVIGVGWVLTDAGVAAAREAERD